MTVHYQCAIFGMIGQIGKGIWITGCLFLCPKKGVTMNTRTFSDIVRGTYGRKIAYADYEEVTSENIIKIVATGVTALNYNRVTIKYLHDYYKGDQPALYRTKTVRDDINNPVVENHAFEIVSFKNAQTYGEPVQCVSTRNDEKINLGVDRLNEYNRNANKAIADIECGEWTSSVGTGFKALQRKKGGVVPYRYICLSPMNTVIVYSSITKEPLLAITQLKRENGNVYYQCFSDTLEYHIQNGKIVLERIHAFGGIPIVEYPNNAHRLSDIEIVISILDAINEIQSNRVDSVAQKVQSFMKFINCEVDEDSFLAMKENGAIVVKSNNGANKADVEIMEQELNQEGTQVAKDDLWDNAQCILAIPNRESQNSGGDTSGAVQLRAGHDMARQRASLKDPYVCMADKRLNRIALKVIEQDCSIRGVANECPINEMDYDVLIVHSPTDNLLVKSEALEILLRSGIHPLVAIKVTGLWADAEKTYIQSKPYLDVLYKTLDQAIEEKNLQGQVDTAKQMLRELMNGNKDI